MMAVTALDERTEASPNLARRMVTSREPKTTFADLDGRTRRFLAGASVTLLATVILGVYLLPLGYMAMTSLKDEDQIARSTILPNSVITIDYAQTPVDVVERVSADGVLQGLTLRPAGQGGDESELITWTGDWEPIFRRIEAAGADPGEVALFTAGASGRAVGGLSLVLPGADASVLLGGNNVPEELAFDGSEASLLAGLDAAGYDLGDVALFTMPTPNGEAPAMALLRPGAAVNALVDPRLLPARAEWDFSFEGLSPAVADVLGTELPEMRLYTVPDADGTVNGVGLLPSEADASIFLDPAITPPEALEWEGTTEALSTRLDEALDVRARRLELFTVPLPDGTSPVLALLQPGPQSSLFVDPENPGAEPIEWTGRVQTLTPVTEFDPTLKNFPDAWDSIDFGRKLFNTAIIAGLGMAGTVLSSTLVAYGLSRFRIPFKSIILISLVATIILPRFVTLVPTYIVFERLGWVGTWWPLIIPHFFANAYNVFLLRQFFLTIPRDLDEAASIDGAGPLTTLVTVILPQAKGAILAVALFHFFFAWNDFLEPLLYLSTEPDRQPISVGLYFFLGLYDADIPLIQSGALLGMAIPIVVYLLLQRVFLSGIDLSGSMK